MRGEEILAAALGLMFEADFPYGDGAAVDLINHVLMENFYLNEHLREHGGKEKYGELSRIFALGDELGFEPRLNEALVLGLLCRVYADEDNPGMLSMYKQEYAAAQRDARRSAMFCEVVKDEY